jgi:hypothetical protein
MLPSQAVPSTPFIPSRFRMLNGPTPDRLEAAPAGLGSHEIGTFALQYTACILFTQLAISSQANAKPECPPSVVLDRRARGGDAAPAQESRAAFHFEPGSRRIHQTTHTARRPCAPARRSAGAWREDDHKGIVFTMQYLHGRDTRTWTSSTTGEHPAVTGERTGNPRPGRTSWNAHQDRLSKVDRRCGHLAAKNLTENDPEITSFPDCSDLLAFGGLDNIGESCRDPGVSIIGFDGFDMNWQGAVSPLASSLSPHTVPRNDSVALLMGLNPFRSPNRHD